MRLLLWIGCLLFAACQAPRQGGIRFSVSAEDGFQTRATRISSSDALQSIDIVKVHAFRSTDGGVSHKYYGTIDLSSAWIKGNNTATRHLSADETLPDGHYRFLAVGADATGEFSVQPTRVVDATDYLTIYGQQEAAVPDEFFAGASDATLSETTTSVAILMTRRVAGVLGYFQRVPVSLNGSTVAFLRLWLEKSTKQFDIIAHIPPAPYAADQPGYYVFDIDLRPQGDADADGFYDGSSSEGVVKLPQTTLAGTYLIPVAATSLTLSLTDSNGIVLRTWKVLDPTGAASYDILSNHFYSIGRKLQTGSTDSDDAEPTNDDAPMDLSAPATRGTIIAGVF